jgi:NifU-like protein involved in Fe-S cluster formation
VSTNVESDISDLESTVGVAGVPGQGPHMAIVLYFSGRLIHKARFSTYGCPAAQSCGQFVCDKIEGGSLESAATVDEAAILAGVGHRPLGREHCPGLAVGALRDAISKVGAGPE